MSLGQKAHTMNFESIEQLIELVEKLREKCPWDRKQTPRTMAVYLLEEVYELVEAIETGSPEEICEELGDLLFHIFFITRLFQETGHFDINSVARGIREKMIHRHPHVFGHATVNNTDEVRKQWQEIKQKEKNLPPEASAMDSVPGGIPALMRAYRMSERAAGTGFEWDDISGVMGKVEEEWGELKAELSGNNVDGKKQERISMEFGDVLFTLVIVARFAKIHPETALTASIGKFEKRFRHMENAFVQKGTPIDSVSKDEMEILWEKAKKETKSHS